MTIVTFVLGIILLAAGAGGLAASFNLLPTELGLLYAACGAIFVCGGVVTIAIGVAILRIEALTEEVNFAAEAGALEEEGEPSEADDNPASESHSVSAPKPEAPEAVPATALAEAAPDRVDDENEQVDEALDEEASTQEAGGAEREVPATSSVVELEQALAETAAPTLVGRYSSGGANYKIFSDGSIEAETESGAFRFASMAEFKAYLARARA